MRTASVLLALALVSVPACKKSGPPEGPTGATITASMPDTPEARAFAERLVAAPIEGRRIVARSGGAAVAYHQIHLDPDGRWRAEATLDARGDEIPCKESGQWRIARASSAEQGTVEWTRLKTNCPGRAADETQRLQLAYAPDGEVTLSFR